MMRGEIASLSAGVLVAAVTLLSPPGALAEEPEREHAWYLPERAKLQLAGNIGFLSPGVGYAFARERLEADLFLGWVPRAIGGDDLFSLTAKLTWLPWTREGWGWRFRPLTLGVQLTDTFGEGFFVREPEGYPGNYHMLPTALRAGFTIGGALGRQAWGLEEIGVYYELVAIDVMLAFWTTNSVLDLDDVFSLALGLRVALW